MRGKTALIVALMSISLPVCAEENSWTRELKDRAKRDSLHDGFQDVRGDSGKWNDDARLQHAPPLKQKPAKKSLDDWADEVLEKKLQPTTDDDTCLIFRTKQLDDNDRVWVERIERRGNQFVIHAHHAVWQGRYFKNFTYYKAIGVNLGTLEAGKYEAKWIIKPLVFAKFEGDGRPMDNWPKDERPAEQKPSELSLAFFVGKSTLASGNLESSGIILWHDIRALGVEGQGWTQTKAPFDRLPGKAEELVRAPVWGLSRHSAGLCVRFVTDAPAIHARWTVTSQSLAMSHMPATGVSGLDLYAKDKEGRWRWLAVGRPVKFPTNEARLADDLPPGSREYLLYLPLYNGVSAVEIGIPKDHTLNKADDRPEGRRKPIVFYGTSITQGGCASRAGMVHTAILGRKLDCPVINMGFSGNGRMEMELARLLAELDPAVFVIDCLPNLKAQEVAERTEPFVRELRKARPKTRILLVEDRSYANSVLVPGLRKHNEQSRAALRKAYDGMVAAGVDGIHYLEGETLLGDDGEDTVDGSHPTDLGFLRQAQAFEKALRPLLKETTSRPGK